MASFDHMVIIFFSQIENSGKIGEIRLRSDLSVITILGVVLHTVHGPKRGEVQ